jgi:rfaE bifunctional protein kinase chain/domain
VKVDVIIFQDYDKGVIDDELIKKVVAKAKANNIPVTVDPKRKNFKRYKNVTLFKPNLKELKEGLNMVVDVNEIASIKKATAQLKTLLNSEILLITLSEKGIFVEYDNGNDKSFQMIPSYVRSISDVSGAGDTVISVASLCVARKIDIELMAFISNMAGGLVCEKVGVVPVSKEELLKEVILHKGL